MGIELTYVLPVKDHLSVFNCALCSNLVSLDGYVTVSCGHCFCQGCFRTWTETQDSKRARGCPGCGVKIASGESDGVVDWQVQTLSKGQPLVHRMLSHVKVLCPCRFSARMCYWTGDYIDLKQHITTSHTQPTANEQTAKSCMISESASEHQELTSGSVVEDGLQSETTKQRTSDHVRKSSMRQQQVETMEERGNAISNRMPKRRSVSIPGIPTKYNPNARNTFNARRDGHQSERGLTTDGISWSKGKRVLNRETSIGSRLNEFNPERSGRKSEEYQRQKPPSTSIPRSISPSSSWSPDAAPNIDAQRHQSGAAIDTSNDTCKSIKNREGQAIEKTDNKVSHRMTRRRSRSLPGVTSEANPTSSNAFNASSSGHQSHDKITVDGTSWGSGKSVFTREPSMDGPLNEYDLARSCPKSEEFPSHIPRSRSPSSLNTTKTNAAPLNADLNTDAWQHHSGTALNASNETSKSTERRPTNETSESLKRMDWPRRKPLQNTRTSTSAPTSLASSRSKENVRLLEKQGDSLTTASARGVECKKKGVRSKSTFHKNLLDSTTIRSVSSSALPPMGQRNQHLAKIERLANLAYKEGKYTIAHDLYTTAIDAYVSAGSPTDVDTELIARLYGNRAAVCIRQSMFKSCVKDCEAALSFNKRLHRACLRKAWALNEMGLFTEACAAVSYGLKDNPGIVELEKELANCKALRTKFALVQSFLDVKKYEEARALLSETRSSLRCAVVLRCKAELGLGNADKVLEALSAEVLQNDFMDNDIIELIAEAHFQNGNADKAIQEAKRAQGYSSDGSENSTRLQLYQDVHSLMLTGQIATEERRFAEAVDSFSTAFNKCGDILPPTAVLLQKLLLLRAEADVRAEQFSPCLDDATRVIALDNTLM